MWQSSFLVLLLIVNTSVAAETKQKTYAIASLLGDELEITKFTTIGFASRFAVYKTSAAEWKNDEYLEKAIAAELEKKLEARAGPVVTKANLPKTMEFGLFGPSDDDKINSLARMEIDADYLVVLYPTNFIAGAIGNGYGFKDSNIGLRHVYVFFEAVLFDLANDKMILNEKVTLHDSYDFTRELVKKDRDELFEYFVNDETDEKRKTTLRSLVYAVPFDEKKLLSTYEKFYDGDSGFEDDLGDLETHIDAATTSIFVDLQQHQPSERQALQKLLQKAFSTVAVELVELLDPNREQDEDEF